MHFWVYLSMMFSVTVTMLVVGKLFLLQVWYNRAFLHSCQPLHSSFWNDAQVTEEAVAAQGC